MRPRQLQKLLLRSTANLVLAELHSKSGPAAASKLLEPDAA
jgi:hypothetical protein